MPEMIASEGAIRHSMCVALLGSEGGLAEFGAQEGELELLPERGERRVEGERQHPGRV